MLRRLLLLALCFAIGGILVAQPANDNCADAIAANTGVNQFITIDATTDGPYHPDACLGGAPDSLYNDVWFTWTATFTGEAEFSTCGTANFDTNIAAYAPGSACPPTEEDLLACSEDGAGCSGFTSETTFNVEEGETYLLRIGGWGSESPGEEGSGTFSITEREMDTGPENDVCEDATEIILNEDEFAEIEFSTIDASSDAPTYEETYECFDVPNGETTVFNDVWFKWTATFTGFAAFSNCGTATFDSRIAVYGPDQTCPPDPLALVGCSDDGIDEDGYNCGSFTSRALFPVQEGSTYLMSLGGWSASGAGEGTVSLERIPPPVPPENDNCMDADSVWILSPESADNFDALFESFTDNASLETTPSPVCRPTGEFFDVWFKFNSGNNTDLSIRFNKTTPQAQFVVDLYDDCETQTDTAEGGFCFRTDAFEDETFIVQEFSGFPGEPREYLLRVSTRVTTDPPGEFWFQLVGEPVTDVQNIKLSNFKLYPNPVAEQAIVEFDLQESQIIHWTILNAMGQEVSRHSLGQVAAGQQRLEVPTGKLSAGLYFLRIETPRGQRTSKFIKQ